jgi:KaiC/GvpD/RAD55 family RecA-like ATPase
MSLPVEVPGLDTIIPQVDPSRVVVVESGADSAKSFFVRRLALTAARIGWKVTFVISRDQEELRAQLTAEGGTLPVPDGWLEIRERDSVNALDEFADAGGLLAVDSFSFLTLGLPGPEIASMMRGLRSVCRRRGTIALLATDRGMFQPQSEAVVTHLADGQLQFHAREAAEGVVRFLRIPKWSDGKFVDRNIYYEFDGRRLAIDLRRRVL